MSDAFDKMKSLKEYSTQTNTEKTEFNYNKEEFKPKRFCIKDYVLNFGRKIVDFMTGFGFVLAGLVFLVFIGACIGSMFPDKYGGYPNANMASLYFLWAIFTPIIIVLITVILNYLIYLLIDIRDSLKNIENKH